jgi:Cys-tRNA(Pro)/Cys-tRNA(Cys) deacylase
MAANNVIRLLEARKIKYQAFELPVEKLGALETARLLNVPPEAVFKTIVVTRPRPGKPILAMIPATSEADLKAIASACGEKKVTLPTQREAEAITGLPAGGISALALINKGFQALIDQSALRYSEIHISGGQLGLNIRLPVRDLVELTRARPAAIAKPALAPSDSD